MDEQNQISNLEYTRYITISAIKFLYVNIQWAYDKRAGTRIKLIGDKLESHFAGSYSQEKLTNRNRV